MSIRRQLNVNVMMTSIRRQLNVNITSASIRTCNQCLYDVDVDTMSLNVLYYVKVDTTLSQ